MAYSFFPNDFQNIPNLQDQLFLMKQKQAAELNEGVFDRLGSTPSSTPKPVPGPNGSKDQFTPSSKQKTEYSHTVYPWQRAKTVREAGEGYKGRKAQDDYMDEDESKLSPEVKADKERYLRLKAEKEERRLNTPVNQKNRYAFGGSDPADKDIDEYKKYDVYSPVYEPKPLTGKRN
jgi:hypothetical protein